MPKARSISRLARIDWDFAGTFSESPFSAIHWHPGRFASQLPASLIGLLSSPGDLVLDPFVGSGTTLVESQRLGRQSVGIDLNPISCLMASAKTLSVSSSKVRLTIMELVQDSKALIGVQRQISGPNSLCNHVPETVQGSKWYTPKVLKHLGSLWGLIATYKGIKRNLAKAAFSAILLKVCRETRHWGYVCDNSAPKDEYEGDVLQEFLQTLDRLLMAYEERDVDLAARFGTAEGVQEARVICGSTIDCLRAVPSESIDLVVTSPPYFGVCDYIKAQRLSMEWFGLDIEPLRLKEIGARSKRHRLAARNAYIQELTAVFTETRRTLRHDARVAVIVGESKQRASVLDELRSCFESAAFRMELDLNRRVSSQRRQAPSIRGEHVFVLCT